jgi:hypothetical protein
VHPTSNPTQAPKVISQVIRRDPRTTTTVEPTITNYQKIPQQTPSRYQNVVRTTENPPQSLQTPSSTFQTPSSRVGSGFTSDSKPTHQKYKNPEYSLIQPGLPDRPQKVTTSVIRKSSNEERTNFNPVRSSQDHSSGNSTGNIIQFHHVNDERPPIRVGDREGG